jgi:WD40 repeat protein
MAAVNTCPNSEQLQQLALGLLPEPVAARVAGHVEGCPRCLQTLRGLPVTDPLLDAVARQRQTDPATQTSDGSTAAGAQLDSVTDAPTLTGPAAAASEPVPAALAGHPRYKVLGLLGSGGMGAVYRAEHLLMSRTVALKVIGPQLLQNPGAAERFLREVRAAAKLSHPNIVAAYDAEQAGDTHFLVMEYVEGESLDRVVRRRGPLPVAEACAYVRQAALGLQHAFEEGMVHRDIKPHNLMLTRGGTVKVLDFGLARFVSENASVSGLTAPGVVMGTPEYIAPEQATDSRSADIRADLYSLGCTLFHLLAGRPPFDGGSALEKVLAHLNEPPPPLGKVRPDVPPALLSVLARLLDKDPARRYRTPAEVAQALAPFTEQSTTVMDLPAGAAPPRRRWPLLIGGLAAAAVVLAVAAGFIMVATARGTLVIETEDKDVAVVVRGGGEEITIADGQTNQQVRLRPGQYEVVPAGGRTGLELSPDHFTVTRGDQVIVHARWTKPAEKPAVAAAPAPISRAGPLEMVEVRRLAGHRGQVNGVALSPDGRTALVGAGPADVRLWDVVRGRLVGPLEGGRERVLCVALSPDGKQAAAGGGGALGNVDERGTDFAIRLWDVTTRQEVRRFEGHIARVTGLAFGPDGRSLLSGSADGTVRLWDIATGREERLVDRGHGVVVSLALSRDGGRALIGGSDGTLRLLDVARARELGQFAAQKEVVLGVALSPDGRQALAGGLDGTVRLWDVATFRELRSFAGPTTGVVCVAFAPDSRLVLAGSGARKLGESRWGRADSDHCLRVWDTATGAERACFREFSQPVTCATFGADGHSILAGSTDRTARLLWLAQPENAAPAAAPGGQGELILAADAAPTPMVVTHGDRLAAVLAPGASRAFLPPGDYNLAPTMAPDELEVNPAAVALRAGASKVIAVRPRPLAREITLVHSLPNPSGYFQAAALSADGRWALTGDSEGNVRLWDLEAGKELPLHMRQPPLVRVVAVSADGIVGVSGGGRPEHEDFALRVWDLKSGQELRRLSGHKAIILSAALSADGHWALTGGADWMARLWDVRTGEGKLLARQRVPVTAVALAADGRRALEVGRDGSARLWDVATQQGIHAYASLGGWVQSVALSPDGRRILASDLDDSMHLWDVATGAELHEFRHPTGVRAVAFSPDGRRALSGSGWRVTGPNRYALAAQDVCVRLWDLGTVDLLARLDVGPGGVGAVAIAVDGRTALAMTSNTLRVLRLPE